MLSIWRWYLAWTFNFYSKKGLTESHLAAGSLSAVARVLVVPQSSLYHLGTRSKYLKNLAYYDTDQIRDPAPSRSVNRVELLLRVMSASDK